MIEYKKHKEIDFEKWDLCIDRALNGIIYPYSFYLNQVSPNWDALIYNNYEAVMPLPVKNKYGIDYVIQPIFVQQLGVFGQIPVSENLLSEFVENIPSRFRYININLNTFNPVISGRNIITEKSVTYELDLISSYEMIRNKYTVQTKRNIKKAEKEKVFITRNDDPMPIIESFRRTRGKTIAHLGDKQYETLKHLIFSGIYRGNTDIYSAFTARNSFCAGIVFFRSHKKTILIFSGSTAEARNNGAMSAIIDRYIADHAGENLTLDFEGSNEKNLARFYAGFGSKECVFLQIKINNLPLILKPIVKMYFFAKKNLY
jgi:hypothetical protein